MNLYTKFAKEFSDTRQSPWNGWSILKKHIDLKEYQYILDLGCGNGRFLKYLIKEKIKIKQYLGIDNSVELLKLNLLDTEFKKNQKDFEIKFEEVDLDKIGWSSTISNKFNLIANFGLMHHISDNLLRKNLISESEKMLRDNGLLILTFWQFGRLDRYKDKIIETKPNNDYILKFGNSGAYRTAHYSTDEEIKILTKDLKLIEIDRFYSDGREDNENLYIIYKKKD